MIRLKLNNPLIPVHHSHMEYKLYSCIFIINQYVNVIMNMFHLDNGNGILPNFFLRKIGDPAHFNEPFDKKAIRSPSTSASSM